MSIDPRLQPFVGSLELAEVGSDDFVRFRPFDGDDHVATMIQSAELFETRTRADLRTLLTRDARDKLYLFAQRRVILGRRTSNRAYFHQALSAFSLLPTLNDVPWTTWFLAALLLGEYAKDPEIVTLLEGSTNAPARRCQSLQKSLGTGSSLAQCHLVEVNTTYGPGMIELPLPRDVEGGYFRAPLIDRDDATYCPRTNLAQLAVDVADGLDRLEGTRTTALGFSLLAFAARFVRATGCLHCCAYTESGAIDVYVAELDSESDAHNFVTEQGDGGGIVVGEGDEIVLFLPQPNFDDSSEAPAMDTSGLEDIAAGALQRI